MDQSSRRFDFGLRKNIRSSALFPASIQLPAYDGALCGADFSAWFYQYLGGIKPDPLHPGFKHFFFTPQPVREIAWVRVAHKTLAGVISIDWKQSDREFNLNVVVPESLSATITLPGGNHHRVAAGSYNYVAPLDR